LDKSSLKLGSDRYRVGEMPALSGFIHPENYDFHLEKHTIGVKSFYGCR
jgi:hypothetical protein